MSAGGHFCTGVGCSACDEALKKALAASWMAGARGYEAPPEQRELAQLREDRAELLEALERRVKCCTCRYDGENGMCPRCRRDRALVARVKAGKP